MAEKTYKRTFDKEVDADELMEYVESHSGATVLELKDYFGTSSRQLRKTLGKLMFRNQVFVVAWRNAVCVMVVDGKPGNPQVAKARAPWADDRPEKIDGSKVAKGKKKARMSVQDDEPKTSKSLYTDQEREDAEILRRAKASAAREAKRRERDEGPAEAMTDEMYGDYP